MRLIDAALIAHLKCQISAIPRLYREVAGTQRAQPYH